MKSSVHVGEAADSGAITLLGRGHQHQYELRRPPSTRLPADTV